MKTRTLLTRNDPHPVELVPASKPSRILLVCDHAGDNIPAMLQSQAPASADMERHIAVDINALATARVIANVLDAPLVIQRYSRLVADMNRPMESEELMPEFSDGTPIPFNQNLSIADRQARLSAIYLPYHNQIEKSLDEMRGTSPAVIAIHSFTPKLKDGEYREWHVDLMSRTHRDFVLRLQIQMQLKFPDLNIGHGEVFQMTDQRDYTLPFHAESRNLLNVSIEIRNDMIDSDAKIDHWGNALARCLPDSMPDEFSVDSATESVAM